MAIRWVWKTVQHKTFLRRKANVHHFYSVSGKFYTVNERSLALGTNICGSLKFHQNFNYQDHDLFMITL